MIHFEQQPEPLDFDERCRKRGNRWLDEHPGNDRPKDYWSEFKKPLANGFSDLCAYTVMYAPNGTVDHYLSCKNYRHLAFEWSNYRFCADWLNKSKMNADDSVLDPFEVQEGWFEILLPSLQMVITDIVPEHLREKAQYTLIRLHLRDDERVIRQRRKWYEMYQNNKLTLEGLRDVAPLIAAAVENQLDGQG